MRNAIFNATFLDGSRGGIVTENGRIIALGKEVQQGFDSQESFDAKGLLLAQGLTDMRAFIGEPGFEYKETIASGTRAAAKGGITTLAMQPTTQPTLDNASLIDYVKRRAQTEGLVHIAPMAALTKGCKGEELCEIGLLRAAGAVAFTDGHRSIKSSLTMRRPLTYARDFDALIVHHVEDADLVGEGVMHEGERASRMGLTGIPHEAETLMLARDIALVRLTGGRYHAAGLSSAASLPLIEQAKQAGLAVTASVSINHLCLNEHDVAGYRTFAKLSPPLRREEDRLALIEAVRSGVIDCIVSDHQPQDVEAKRLPFSEAAFGASGLETLLPAALRLYHNNALSLTQLWNALAVNPSRLIGATNRLAVGQPADFILIDIDKPWILNRENMLSKCKNTPFDDAKFMGQVADCYVGGVKIA
jgi:dihydroorotase